MIHRAILLFTVLLAIGTSAADPFWLNPKDFGAIGDGIADDTGAIRRTIAAATTLTPEQSSPHRQIALPPGIYRITETLLLLPEADNLIIHGSGGIGGAFGSRMSTTLQWDGAEGGILIDCRAHKNLQLRNLTLHGGDKAAALIRLNSADDANAEHPRWVKQYGQRAGTGFHFELVRLLNADTGILLGDDSKYNGDLGTFIGLVFAHLETGVKSRATQNLCFSFIRTDFGYVGTAFDFDGGGFLSTSLVNTHHTDTVFNLRNTGINSGVFVLDMVRPEQNSRNPKVRTVALRASGEINIQMTGFMSTASRVFPPDGDPHTPLFVLGPGANVQVSSSMVCGAIAELTGSDNDVPTFLTFENTRFRCFSNPDTGITVTGNAGYRLRDCQITDDKLEDGKYVITGRRFVADRLQAPPR